jgi:hypothetical protein
MIMKSLEEEQGHYLCSMHSIMQIMFQQRISKIYV